MEALRDALGDGVDIMVDCHGRHAPANAIEFCRVLAPYRPYFVEEPVPPENVDAMAEVRRASPVPIATGERLVTRYEFREVFEKQACHIIQPDLCHCGGLWEAKKIAAMAEAYYMGVAPHNPLGPVANAAALHFALSTPNFLIQEDMLSRRAVALGGGAARVEDRERLLAADRRARAGHRGERGGGPEAPVPAGGHPRRDGRGRTTGRYWIGERPARVRATGTGAAP